MFARAIARGASPSGALLRDLLRRTECAADHVRFCLRRSRGPRTSADLRRAGIRRSSISFASMPNIFARTSAAPSQALMRFQFPPGLRGWGGAAPFEPALPSRRGASPCPLRAPPRTLGRKSTGAPGLNEIRHCGKRASRSRDPDVGLIARGVWRHCPHGQGDMVRRVRGISQKLIQEGNWFFAPVIGPHSLRELFLAVTERAGAGGAPRLRRADSSVNATDVRACISFLASRRSWRKVGAMRAFPARARACSNIIDSACLCFLSMLFIFARAAPPAGARRSTPTRTDE